MKRPLALAITFLFFCSAAAIAQFAGFGDVPIEIHSEQTRFENGVAIAERNVVIHYADTVIYCDYAQYIPDTHDVLVSGNVRIYREGKLFTGERAVYNLETHQLTAADFRGEAFPFSFATETFNTLGPNAYQARGALFTTSPTSKPDYSLRARSVRIYPKDHIVLQDAKLYLGETPVFWFPYLYQSINKDDGFMVIPGYNGTFGAYARSRYAFPITNEIAGVFHFDILSKRGVGIGLDSSWDNRRPKLNKSKSLTDPLVNTTDSTPKATGSSSDSGDDETAEGDANGNHSWGRFRSYYIHDASPGTNKTGVARTQVDPERYRVSFQDRTYLTEDIFTTININKLSDSIFLQDFEPGSFRTDPNPDNLFSITKWNEDYTLTLMARVSLNEFFDFTERLPELALDVKRKPIFGQSGFFYDGETSTGFLRRNFANESLFQDYDTFRADTFHQLTYPINDIGGWLNIIPKAGIRGTYYSNGGHLENELTTQTTTLSDGTVVNSNTMTPVISTTGAATRVALNAGVEASFKLTRAYEQVQSRAWGLDGLRHVIQPYTDLSYLWTNRPPEDLLQVDRINPTDKWQMLDFPQFNSIDSLDRWAIARIGVFNRFQTRRDDITINWLELNTFLDINAQRPEFEKVYLLQPQQNGNTTNVTSANGVVADPGTFSNVHSIMTWQPLSWARLNIDSQFPMLDTGFTEVNTNTNFMVSRDLQVGVSHRYINGNPLYTDSNFLILSSYLRLSDNWGFSIRESYEFEISRLEQQSYTLHRDLSSWIASFGIHVIDNGAGKTDFGVALTFTLKDLPQVGLPISFDPSSVLGPSSKNPQ